MNNNISAQKMKECSKCKVMLPATSEHFYSQAKGLYGMHSVCKKCKSEYSRRAYEEKGIKKRHNLVCEWCGSGYKSETKKRRFCSKNCQADWQRNSDEYKEIHNGGRNQFGSVETREKVFSEKFNEKYNNKFIYHSEFKSIDETFMSECLSCGYVQERNAQCVRRNREIKCDQCIKQRQIVRDMIRENQAQLHSQIKTIKSRVNMYCKKVERKLLETLKTCLCIECGEEFLSVSVIKLCSDKCRRKRGNRLRELNRRLKLKENGEVDYSITLDKLIKRDKKVCKLCGEKVNKKDYVTTEEGYFIAGNSYPSIDHILPVARGGTHTWDNIQLAHRSCNAEKSDNETYEFAGQLVLSI